MWAQPSIETQTFLQKARNTSPAEDLSARESVSAK